MPRLFSSRLPRLSFRKKATPAKKLRSTLKGLANKLTRRVARELFPPASSRDGGAEGGGFSFPSAGAFSFGSGLVNDVVNTVQSTAVGFLKSTITGAIQGLIVGKPRVRTNVTESDRSRETDRLWRLSQTQKDAEIAKAYRQVARNG